MIFINPGAGPIHEGTREQADENIKKFVVDLGIPSAISPVPAMDRGGRFTYRLGYNGKLVFVEMPGIDLERVRYMGRSDQDIWDFPRLYVDGSSWLWRYALEVCFAEEEGE